MPDQLDQLDQRDQRDQRDPNARAPRASGQPLAGGPAAERRPNLDSLFSINPDGSRNAIHPAAVRGRFQRIKAALWVVLIAVYLALPWMEIGGRPAFLIDIERRHFYLFGATFTAQDFWLASFVVSGIGFALVVLSALAGRVWCGYACPQTVFLEGIYRRIESWIDGTPRRRRELERAPWTWPKIWRRALKLAAFLAVSLLLSHTLLSYFMPVGEVFRAMLRPPSEHLTAFVFVLVLTALLFANFTWFREQLCIVVCPYGRLQGVLYDLHTIQVGYDARRGEPRGVRRRAGTTTAGATTAGATTAGATTAGASRLGDCVDCYRCVAVCPTGIDIRNGTQLECIGCANCIDACDAVMDKLGRPRGLIRYDSLAGFTGQPRRFLRPRVALYALLLAAGVAVFAISTSRRTPFEASLLRLDATPYRLDGDTVTNALSLHLENKTPQPLTFHLRVRGDDDLTVVLPLQSLTLEALADQRVPLFLRIPRERYRPGLTVAMEVQTDSESKTLSLPVLGPATR
jgi:cytochrome c oxidase accessory protein FixG